MTRSEGLARLASARTESGVKLFLAELGRHRLLSAAEEVALAKRWIWQAVARALANQAKTIRIPTHVSERHQKLARAARTLQPALGPEPSLEELAEVTGLPPGASWGSPASACTSCKCKR